MTVKRWSALLLLLSGCSGFGALQASGRPVTEAYGGSHELRVLDVETPLRRERAIPVLSTPEVFAAFVPPHAERDVFVGDHWVYFRLSEPQWYSERLQQPEPTATGDAPPESLKALREADWGKAVVPSRP